MLQVFFLNNTAGIGVSYRTTLRRNSQYKHRGLLQSPDIVLVNHVKDYAYSRLRWYLEERTIQVCVNCSSQCKYVSVKTERVAQLFFYFFFSFIDRHLTAISPDVK